MDRCIFKAAEQLFNCGNAIFALQKSHSRIIQCVGWSKRSFAFSSKSSLLKSHLLSTDANTCDYEMPWVLCNGVELCVVHNSSFCAKSGFSFCFLISLEHLHNVDEFVQWGDSQKLFVYTQTLAYLWNLWISGFHHRKALSNWKEFCQTLHFWHNIYQSNTSIAPLVLIPSSLTWLCPLSVLSFILILCGASFLSFPTYTPNWQ